MSNIPSMPTRCIASGVVFSIPTRSGIASNGYILWWCLSDYICVCVCVFCAGGELFTLLEREGVFLEDAAR
jgi:hypothetical protein